MAKPALFIAAAAVGFTFFLFASALWLERACPGRVMAMVASAGAPMFKVYHIGENPWAGTWVFAEGMASATNTGSHRDRPQRLAGESATTDSCERTDESAKPGFSS